MREKLKQFKVLIPLAITSSCLIFVLFFNIKELRFRDWTGFSSSKLEKAITTTELSPDGKTITKITVTDRREDGKTFWDWLSLLGVPLTLAVLGYKFQQLQQKQAEDLAKIERKRAEERAEAEQLRTEEQARVEKEIAEINRKEEALQGYFDRLSKLIIDVNLMGISKKLDSDLSKSLGEHSYSVVSLGEYNPTERIAAKEQLDAATDLIRVFTLSILRRLQDDPVRKSSVIQFLAEAEIFSKLNLSLKDADLKAANLEYASLMKVDLESADLSGANLHSARLWDAYLGNANLGRANLEFANLSGAKLINANFADANLMFTDLKRANLWGANLKTARNWKEEQLSSALLCRTILPIGCRLDPNRDCEEINAAEE